MSMHKTCGKLSHLKSYFLELNAIIYVTIIYSDTLFSYKLNFVYFI